MSGLADDRAARAEIEPRVSEQERRIAEYREKIAERRKETLQLSLERQRMEEELTAFEHEYSAKVGRLYGELDRVQLEIKETLYRARLVERGDAQDEASLNRRVERAFRVERRKVEEDAAPDPPEERSADAPADAPKPDGETRALYLRLAKRYHPDKAERGSDDPFEPEEERKRIMALINAAYEAGDASRLEQLSATLDDPFEEAPEEEGLNERERRLYRDFMRLDRAVRQLRREIERFKARETYRLKESVAEAKERGQDLLGDLGRDLQAKVDAAKHRLKRVSDQVKRLMEKLFGSAGPGETA